MGTITRSFANNLTTGGVLKADAFNNASLNNVTALNAAVATGNMVLLSSQTANDSASISFTTGIDSTYKEYQFWFINIYPRSNRVNFTFNMSTDGGSNYNVTKTSSAFITYHNEPDIDYVFAYDTSLDLAQSTAFQPLGSLIVNDADSNLGGSMSLFNPSSTTYVKHYISNTNLMYVTSNLVEYYTMNSPIAGYGNTTSAINAVQFKMSSGNFDGTILMYGIK